MWMPWLTRPTFGRAPPGYRVLLPLQPALELRGTRGICGCDGDAFGRRYRPRRHRRDGGCVEAIGRRSLRILHGCNTTTTLAIGVGRSWDAGLGGLVRVFCAPGQSEWQFRWWSDRILDAIALFSTNGLPRAFGASSRCEAGYVGSRTAGCSNWRGFSKETSPLVGRHLSKTYRWGALRMIDPGVCTARLPSVPAAVASA